MPVPLKGGHLLYTYVFLMLIRGNSDGAVSLTHALKQ